MGLGNVSLTAPHPSTLDRSLPVPSGRTATGGNGSIQSSSMIESTQPTVPSPPQAKIRTLLRSLKNWRLRRGKGEEREGKRLKSEGKKQSHLTYNRLVAL